MKGDVDLRSILRSDALRRIIRRDADAVKRRRDALDIGQIGRLHESRQHLTERRVRKDFEALAKIARRGTHQLQ